MRQVVISRYGPPDVLRIEEAPDPTPGAGEARIRVRAAGVNFADVLARLGLYPDAPKPPLVVGYEVSGVVDAVGSGVTALSEGDRVLALTRFGGYSDVAVTPVTRVFQTPERIERRRSGGNPRDVSDGSDRPLSDGERCRGETVLIHNAGGGVGIAAAQLAGCAAPESWEPPRPPSTTRSRRSVWSMPSTIGTPMSNTKS